MPGSKAPDEPRPYTHQRCKITEPEKPQVASEAAQSALAHTSHAASLAELSATIAHEVNQPLAAIAMRERPACDGCRMTSRTWRRSSSS